MKDIFESFIIPAIVGGLTYFQYTLYQKYHTDFLLVTVLFCIACLVWCIFIGFDYLYTCKSIRRKERILREFIKDKEAAAEARAKFIEGEF